MAFINDPLDARDVYESICFARPHMRNLTMTGFRQTKMRFTIWLQSDEVEHELQGNVVKAQKIIRNQKAMVEAGY